MKQFSPKKLRNQASSVLLDLYLYCLSKSSCSHGLHSVMTRQPISLGNHAWEKRMGGELRTWEPFDQGGTCVFFFGSKTFQSRSEVELGS